MSDGYRSWSPVRRSVFVRSVTRTGLWRLPTRKQETDGLAEQTERWSGKETLTAADLLPCPESLQTATTPTQRGSEQRCARLSNPKSSEDSEHFWTNGNKHHSGQKKWIRTAERRKKNETLLGQGDTVYNCFKVTE